MSEAKWYQKLRFWLWEKRLKISAVVYAMIFMVAGALFVWNIIYAKSEESNTNVLTAIAGWVGFFATVGIGIITIVQGRWFSEDNEYTIKEMKSCVDRIEKCVDKIDESLWREGIPVVMSKLHGKIKMTIINLENKYWEQYSYAGFDDVRFDVTPELDATKGYFCTRIIEFPIINFSKYPIQAVECFKVSLDMGDGKETVYYNQADIEQGFMSVNETKKMIIEVSDIGKFEPVDNQRLIAHLYLQFVDFRGNYYKSIWEVGTDRMVYSKNKKQAIGDLVYAWYTTKRASSDRLIMYDEEQFFEE